MTQTPSPWANPHRGGPSGERTPAYDQSAYDQPAYDHTGSFERPAPQRAHPDSWQTQQLPTHSAPSGTGSPYAAPPPHNPAPTPWNGIQHPPGAFGTPAQPVAAPQPVPTRAPRERPSGGGRTILVATVTALIVGGLAGFGGAQLADNPTSPVARPATGASTSAPPPIPPATGPMDSAAVAERLLVSTVTISYRAGNSGGTGSGFVLDNDGHIITNNHVVEGAAQGGQVMVEFADGSEVPATIVGRSPSYDLAVIRVAGGASLTPTALGDSDAVKPGQPVLAVGAPLGLGGTVTSGIISAVDRPLGVGDDSNPDAEAAITYINGIQTDAPINPGNSGGPLADGAGNVIGVNSAILTLGGASNSGRGGNIGLGFAIPINQTKVIATEIIRDGHATYPVIGASVGRSGNGVLINEILPGGPADAAGLRNNDVVTAVGGREVDTPTDMIVRIRSHRPGDQVTLDVVGRGPVTVTLGSKVG